MSANAGPLGQQSEFPKAFAPGLLHAIPRLESRARIGIPDRLPFVGYDEWTLYELAWLDMNGSHQNSMVSLKVPADSESIVESKSLKLYANSLFYQRFESRKQLGHQIRSDLDQLLNTQISLEFISLERGFQQERSNTHVSVDEHPAQPGAAADPGTLHRTAKSGILRYCSNRFRSLCPVTGQPDWATLYVRLDGAGVTPESLALYLAGFAEHPGFHEACIEQIYVDLSRALQPEQLSVAARFLRRGGLDINPVRASSWDVLELPGRTIRQ